MDHEVFPTTIGHRPSQAHWQRAGRSAAAEPARRKPGPTRTSTSTLPGPRLLGQNPAGPRAHRCQWPLPSVSDSQAGGAGSAMQLADWPRCGTGRRAKQATRRIAADSRVRPASALRSRPRPRSALGTALRHYTYYRTGTVTACRREAAGPELASRRRTCRAGVSTIDAVNSHCQRYGAAVSALSSPRLRSRVES